MAVRTGPWTIQRAAPDSGLLAGDVLNVTGTAIRVTRSGTPRPNWGTNYNGGLTPATVDFNGLPHILEDDGNAPGTLTCNLKNGFVSGTVWTATAEDGSGHTGPRGKEKEEKEKRT